jgi:uncharacterized protein YecT (DUF1311 family)
MKFLSVVVIGLVIALIFMIGLSKSQVVIDNCEKFTKTLDLSSCYVNLYKKSDQNLNRVYNEILNKLKGKKSYEMVVQKFITEQRSWLKLRDATCDFAESLAFGGSEVQIIKFSCLFNKTNERVKELIDYKKNPAIY